MFKRGPNEDPKTHFCKEQLGMGVDHLDSIVMVKLELELELKMLKVASNTRIGR